MLYNLQYRVHKDLYLQSIKAKQQFSIYIYDFKSQWHHLDDWVELGHVHVPNIGFGNSGYIPWTQISLKKRNKSIYIPSYLGGLIKVAMLLPVQYSNLYYVPCKLNRNNVYNKHWYTRLLFRKRGFFKTKYKKKYNPQTRRVKYKLIKSLKYRIFKKYKLYNYFGKFKRTRNKVVLLRKQLKLVRTNLLHIKLFRQVKKNSRIRGSLLHLRKVFKVPKSSRRRRYRKTRYKQRRLKFVKRNRYKKLKKRVPFHRRKKRFILKNMYLLYLNKRIAPAFLKKDGTSYIYHLNNSYV